MNRFYYSSSFATFLDSSTEEVLGTITEANVFDLTLEQKGAWIRQIIDLKQALSFSPLGHIFFEYTIPRMGKRCDCVLIKNDHLVILEFKNGATQFGNADKNQAIDYALDLKNFHKESHYAKIIPVLVASDAKVPAIADISFSEDNISQCLLANSDSLKDLLDNIENLPTPTSKLLPQIWSKSPYKPTPTIIEAAKALYRDHDVTAISRSDAGGQNLVATASFIDKVIAEAKDNHHKSVCFITGVPGAGKTLAGLNIATARNNTNTDEHAVFLSGNGPLVTVLQTALAQDQKVRTGETLSEAKRKTSAFIQNIHHFRDAYLADPNPPEDKVVVFDEAQRAWTKEKASKFMKTKKGVADFDQSEPSFLLEVMDRHDDWCVVIALVGGGQEINDGEAGLPEWFKAMSHLQKNWKTYYSPDLDSAEYTHGKPLQSLLPENAQEHSDLHLAVSIRSFRAENLSCFINRLISNEAAEAKAILTQHLDKYPIILTRNFETAKQWILDKKRGSERIGITASAGAKRLVPYGIHMKVNIEPEKWFLGDETDIRSSDFLELAASQFDIQGLEIDWAIVCWDGDLRHNGSNWEHHSFKGSKWQKVNKREDQLYLRNAYRVLLTRARQGLIIFIPEGSTNDQTRQPSYYDKTFDYLVSCGVPALS